VIMCDGLTLANCQRRGESADIEVDACALTRMAI